MLSCLSTLCPGGSITTYWNSPPSISLFNLFLLQLFFISSTCYFSLLPPLPPPPINAFLLPWRLFWGVNCKTSFLGLMMACLGSLQRSLRCLHPWMFLIRVVDIGVSVDLDQEASTEIQFWEERWINVYCLVNALLVYFFTLYDFPGGANFSLSWSWWKRQEQGTCHGWVSFAWAVQVK